MQLFKFNDENKKIYNLDHVVKIQKYNCESIIVETINSTDQLFYEDDTVLDNDMESISNLINSQQGKIKETINNGINMFKENAIKATAKMTAVPIGYRFTKDFNGMITKFKAGEVALVSYMFDAYHVIGRNGETLFRISEEASKDYGYLIYE